MQKLEDLFLKKYKEWGIPQPDTHFVLGSLIGSELKAVEKNFPEWKKIGTLTFAQAGLSVASAPSHSGSYEYFYHKEKNKSICFQCGRLHGYEGLTPQEVVQTVMGPRLAGTKKFVLTNISGGLKKELTPGTVLAIKDHINFTGQSPLIGLCRTQAKDFYFLDMSTVYLSKINNLITNEMQKKNLKVFSGVYIGVLGPQYETPAEVNLFAQWGGDVVGMSTIWEVMALHYSRAEVSAFSVVANPACGIEESMEIKPALLKPTFQQVIESFFNIV